MKIGLVCPYNMFKGGGVREHINLLYDGLVSLGHDVKIITPMPRDYEGEIPEHIITIGASANVKAFLNTQSQFSAAVDTDAIDVVLENEKFDILHFHEPFVPFLSRQIISRSKCINIATVHAQIPDRFTSKTLINVVNPYSKSMLKYMDIFTAVSEPAAEYITSITTKPITIIPNGINLKQYDEVVPPSTSSGKTILYFGRLEKRKGIKYLLQAYAILAARNKEVHLLLAGSGPEEKSLRNYVEQNEIPRVKFLSYFVSEEDKIKLMKQSDVFCSAARYGESFGIVLLEAMASGTPIVAGDNPGYKTVLKGTGRLSLVNSQDSEDFARRLELLIYDEDLRQLWKNWAAKNVVQYDYMNIVKQYEQLYKEALSGNESK